MTIIQHCDTMCPTLKQFTEKERTMTKRINGYELKPGANLIRANLTDVNLTDVNLTDVNLRNANLTGANLTDVNLIRANLTGANLTDVNLRNANLIGANLYCANLTGANLTNTCLDPNNKPNAQVSDFQTENGFVIGYRTQSTPYIRQYLPGRIYSADFFSTCETECHPGLYLWPTKEQTANWGRGPYVKVRTKPEDVHQAGIKWRCRWFEVIETFD